MYIIAVAVEITYVESEREKPMRKADILDGLKWSEKKSLSCNARAKK